MDNLIEVFFNNPIDAIYFFIPAISSFLFIKMRKKINRNRMVNLLFGFLSIIGFSIAFIFCFLLIATLLNTLLIPIKIETINKLIIPLLICSIIISCLDRQYFLLSNVIVTTNNEEQYKMSHSVEEISSSTRQEIWMFCGTLSFLDREEKNLKDLLKTIKIKALCLNSDDEAIKERYKRAQEIGIELRNYPSKSYDKGIRGRIIDPYNISNSSAILIEKKIVKETSSKKKGFSYSTYLIDCSNNPTEINLLINIFEIVWEISN